MSRARSVAAGLALLGALIVPASAPADIFTPVVSITSGSPDPMDRTPTFTFTSSDTSSFECSVDSAPFATCTSPYTTTVLNEGSHSFQVRGVGLLGGRGAPATRSFIIDLTAPETMISSGPSGLVNTRSVSFGFTSDDSQATFRCRLDSEAFQACASPYARSNVADGAHSFEVKARDTAGNDDQTPASRSFTVDATAPTTAIGGPSGLINNRSPQFTLTSPESGVAFECRLEPLATGFATCPPSFQTDVLADGSYTLRARATDQAGNVGPDTTRSFTVDATKPVVTITGGPTGTVETGSNKFTFTSEAGATFECAVDSGFAPCTSPFDTGDRSDGPHAFRVRAEDAAGNTSDEATRTYTIDSRVPDTTIDTGPSGGTRENRPTFTFGSVPNTTDFQCRFDGAAFAACSSPHRSPTVLSEGGHTFEVRARNSNGTDQTPASRTFTVDSSPPPLTISGPSGLINDPNPEFTLSSTEAGAQIECRIVPQAPAFVDCPSPLRPGPLPDGDYTLFARAKDAVGPGDPMSRAFTIDTTAPSASIAGPSGTVATKVNTFTFDANEAGAIFECALDSAAFINCTSPFTTPEQADGPHEFRVRARDAAGNTGAPVFRAYTIDSTTPPAPTTPETTIDAGVSGITSNNRPTFRFSSDAAGATFNCRIDGGPVRPCNSGSFTAGPLADGNHVFSVASATAAGQDPTPAEASFRVDATGPTVRITRGPDSGEKSGKKRAVKAGAVRFSFVSSDADVMFRCKFDHVAYAICSSPFAPVSMTKGKHVFRVRGLDTAGNFGKAAKAHFVVKGGKQRGDREPPPPIDPAADPCAATPTLTGTDASERIRGTAGNDVIQAGGGNDQIDGLGGNDLICASLGDDTITGGDGNDIISGGPGNDKLGGGGGDDRLAGDAGDDIIEGGDGNDLLAGGAGSDFLAGNAGRDVLDAGPDEDRCDGGAGKDSGSSCERAQPF